MEKLKSKNEPRRHMKQAHSDSDLQEKLIHVILCALRTQIDFLINSTNLFNHIMKNPNSQIKENHSPFLKFLPGKSFPASFINNIERERERENKQ